MRRIIRHILYNREVYLFPLVSIGLLLGVISGVPMLTGRAVIDDPGAIVGWVYNLCGIAMLVLMVGQAQQHLFGFRATGPESRLQDDIFDACNTVFLLLFFGWLLWH